MKVEIKVTGARGSGKTRLLRLLEREIMANYSKVTLIMQTENAHIDGIPAEILELEVHV